jgi:uncharacterized protein (DUF697 family)
MDKRRAIILLLAVVAAASLVMPAGFATPCVAFIGAGINMEKHLGNTIDFNLNPTLVQAAGIAQGLAAMNLGISWGVDYDLNSLAGYPYGYGGVGAITDANIGYSLGMSLDEAHGTAFDGAGFGIPLAEQSLSRTQFNNVIAANNHITDAQVALPWAFPVL